MGKVYFQPQLKEYSLGEIPKIYKVICSTDILYKVRAGTRVSIP